MGRILNAAWAFMLLLGSGVPGQAETPTPPPEIAELRRLLATPSVQAWLAEAPEAAAPAEDAALAVGEALAETLDPASMAAFLERTGAHRARIARGVPELPRALASAGRTLAAQAKEHGVWLVAAMVAALVGAGLLVEWRYVRATRGLRKMVLGSDEDDVPARLRKLAFRVGLALGAVAAFAVASLGVLMLIDLPPLLKEVAGRVLFAAIMFRLLAYGARILLAPGAPSRRVVPMGDAWAAFWQRRIVTFGAVFLIGWTFATSLRTLGAPYPAPLIVAYVFGAGLLGVAFSTIWGRRARLAGDGLGGVGPAAGWTLWTALLFGLWLTGAFRLFWLVMVAGLLPIAIGVVNAAVNHLLRESARPDEETGDPPSVLAAVIERGARMALIVGAAALLLWAWGVGLAQVVGGEDGVSRMARVIVNVAVVVFAFDFIWHVSRTAIDRFIAEATEAGLDPIEARRRARLRTLLPILRNVLQMTLAVTGALMILATLGVQIAPLIAGAGVLGVAIGFGAQSVVKDLIAGMFYLLDDAFRVGEYIVAGNYKGTVESFSLRSIKLRHHRGPVYTIPFGSLGAVQNMTREWVIEKMAFTVPFDTDVDKLKKVVKGVSAELLADPDLGPGFIEPMKSQGIDAIGDHGLRVVVKFKAIPGRQFPIRRRANAMIKKAFAENGIAFAFPTVRVAGTGGTEERDGASASIELARAAG